MPELAARSATAMAVPVPVMAMAAGITRAGGRCHAGGVFKPDGFRDQRQPAVKADPWLRSRQRCAGAATTARAARAVRGYSSSAGHREQRNAVPGKGRHHCGARTQ